MQPLKMLATVMVALATVTGAAAFAARTATMQEWNFVHYQDEAPRLFYPAAYGIRTASALPYRGDVAKVLPTYWPTGPLAKLEAVTGIIQSRILPPHRYGVGTWVGHVLEILDQINPAEDREIMGSGIYIEGGYYVTAWRNLEGADMATLMVTDTEGSHLASLLAYDEVADLAILTVDRPVPMAGLPLAKTDRRRGRLCGGHGWPPGVLPGHVGSDCGRYSARPMGQVRHVPGH